MNLGPTRRACLRSMCSSYTEQGPKPHVGRYICGARWLGMSPQADIYYACLSPQAVDQELGNAWDTRLCLEVKSILRKLHPAWAWSRSQAQYDRLLSQLRLLPTLPHCVNGANSAQRWGYVPGEGLGHYDFCGGVKTCEE